MELAKPKNWVDHAAIWCAKYLIFIILALGFGSSAAASPDYKWMGAVLMALIIFVAWACAFGLQYVFRRPRPFKSGHPALIRMLFETPSFPSAHTAMASSVAATFFHGGRFGFGIIFALLAFIMAWSRVRTHLHYASDTFAGAIVGMLAVFMTPFFLMIIGVIE